MGHKSLASTEVYLTLGIGSGRSVTSPYDFGPYEGPDRKGVSGLGRSSRLPLKIILLIMKFQMNRGKWSAGSAAARPANSATTYLSVIPAGFTEIRPNSCNNRHRPCCQAPELIKGIAYYHAIFTVPYEVNDPIYDNQKELYSLLFRCTSDTLLTLCRDRKYLGATPGLVMVLYTWGQKLNFIRTSTRCCPAAV